MIIVYLSLCLLNNPNSCKNVEVVSKYESIDECTKAASSIKIPPGNDGYKIESVTCSLKEEKNNDSEQ